MEDIEELTFQSAGRSISVDAIRPDAALGSAPILVLLHGASGVLAGNQYVRRLAQALAGEGYATYLPHYFERTGTLYADENEIRSHYGAWREAVSDLLDSLGARAEAGAGRVGLLGYSLGGYLAVTESAFDQRVQAVVEIAGGVEEETFQRGERAAATLILHGASDRRVPVDAAWQLEKWLQRVSAPYEMQIYPNEGHLFSPWVAMDALQRSMAFLGKHLR